MSLVYEIVGGVAMLVLAYWLGTNTNDAVNEEQVRNIVNTSFEECMAANVVLEEKLNQHITVIEQLEKLIALITELFRTEGKGVYRDMLNLLNEWQQRLQASIRRGTTGG